MNKTISNLRSSLAAAVTVGLILGTASVTLGATASDSVAFSGTAAPVATIAVDHATFTTLDIHAGASAVTVATATEICNSQTGYKVALESANAVAAGSASATLKGSAVATNTVSYTILYNGVGVTLGSDGKTASGTAAFTADAPTIEAGVQHALAVTFAGVWKPADTYSDTITLTIAAK